MTIPAPFSPFISGYTFFESPRWHDGQLWLSDFYTQQIVRVTLQGEVTPVAEVGDYRFTPGALSLDLMETYGRLVRRQA